MRVLIVTEYYPRAHDPVRGVWVHRQALAARQAGADVRVLVLHRPLPPLSSVRRLDLGAARRELAQPSRTELDGIPVDYLRYISPPRPLSYASWGAWAAPWLRLRLSSLRRSFAFALVHAHYAVPAGDAVRRAAPDAPLLISVHGHDVFGTPVPEANVGRALRHARMVLANSAGTASRCAAAGASATRVVHLGADLPAAVAEPPAVPTLVTVGHLAARKRHRDVIAALARLRARSARYVIVGDGPEREPLQTLASSLGVADRVEFRGALPHHAAVAAAQSATVFVLPSVDEAFGVAYIEAMAGGVPAIGCRGEAGPEELAAAGGGIALVAPGDIDALAAKLDELLGDPGARARLGAQARGTVEREFTWAHCGRETVAAYGAALRGSP